MEDRISSVIAHCIVRKLQCWPFLLKLRLVIWRAVSMRFTSGLPEIGSGSCIYNIRQLRTNKSSLTLDALQHVAYPLILSRIDYCNSLYAGLPAVTIQRLQGLINTAAMTLSGRSWLSHASNFIRNDLHWLPVTRNYVRLCRRQSLVLHRPC